jgi:hypothetical protein
MLPYVARIQPASCWALSHVASGVCIACVSIWVLHISALGCRHCRGCSGTATGKSRQCVAECIAVACTGLAQAWMVDKWTLLMRWSGGAASAWHACRHAPAGWGRCSMQARACAATLCLLLSAADSNVYIGRGRSCQWCAMMACAVSCWLLLCCRVGMLECGVPLGTYWDQGRVVVLGIESGKQLHMVSSRKTACTHCSLVGAGIGFGLAVAWPA